MKTISVNYTIKYELKNNPKYVWLNDNSCFNVATGRKIKQTIVGGSIGYCIDGKFRSLKSLRNNLVKVVKTDCPF